MASSSCVTENEDEDKHIITGISDGELNDYHNTATDDNTLSDGTVLLMLQLFSLEL